jgi:hypothetical protein
LNIVDVCGECGGNGYVDCICDYAPDNNNTCSSSGTTQRPYVIGDQLSCDDLETELSPCYPDDCTDSFSLHDFEGRVFWIIYEEDW